MAEFISQEEIDKLLSTVNKTQEVGHSSPVEEQPAPDLTFRDASKVFKYKENPVKKFRDDYISPVIKREDIMYKPVARSNGNSHKKVVYTIEHYRGRDN